MGWKETARKKLSSYAEKQLKALSTGPGDAPPSTAEFTAPWGHPSPTQNAAPGGHAAQASPWTQPPPHQGYAPGGHTAHAAPWSLPPPKQGGAPSGHDTFAIHDTYATPWGHPPPKPGVASGGHAVPWTRSPPNQGSSTGGNATHPAQPTSASSAPPNNHGSGNAADLVEFVPGYSGVDGVSGRPTLPVGRKQRRLLNDDLLFQVNTRPHSARVKLGDKAVEEARKGLSRVIYPGNDADIEVFAAQLKSSDVAACEPDYLTCDDGVTCFALSYVQNNPPVGRFKFSREQWTNFKVALAEIFACGVARIRLWLDQCLWLRDASQESWAHTGLMPYVLWPVISLGTNGVGGERTLDTYSRMWPFVEEVAALWSMGVIITSEMRGRRVEDGCRRWLSYNARKRLEPEMSMTMILLNVFHGATDQLHTGWKEDVEELQEMALWNFTCDSEELIIGSDWRSRIAAHMQRVPYEAVQNLGLPIECEYGGVNLYLDGSRVVKTREPWHGLREWISGNESGRTASTHDVEMLSIGITKFCITTDRGEFQLLKLDNSDTHSPYYRRSSPKRGEIEFVLLWLLVAMDGRSSNFSRGHVAWTKILQGESSCHLYEALEQKNILVLQNVLKDQLQCKIRVTSAEEVDLPIEWT